VQMMGKTSMNGVTPQPMGVPATMGPDTPLAYYQPTVITLATVRWIVGGIIGAIWSMYAAGWLFLPAKQSEFEALTKVVQTLDNAQKDSRQALERLTVAVDNLSGLVNRIPKQALTPGKRGL
jgi:hypothetical protein